MRVSRKINNIAAKANSANNDAREVKFDPSDDGDDDECNGVGFEREYL